MTATIIRLETRRPLRQRLDKLITEIDATQAKIDVVFDKMFARALHEDGFHLRQRDYLPPPCDTEPAA